MSVEDVAMGFIKVANESMCRPIRTLTQVSRALFKYIVCVFDYQNSESYVIPFIFIIQVFYVAPIELICFFSSVLFNW